MLVELAIASSLWVASQEAGMRPDSQASIVPVETIADDFGKDLAWIVGSHAADLYSTAWAIQAGGVEGNPLGPTPEARIALKAAGVATVGIVCWKLRRDGHARGATVVRWLSVALNGAFVVNNARLALK
jgi:hypothetical protein